MHYAHIYMQTRLTGDEVEHGRRRQPAVAERLGCVQDPAPDHKVHHEKDRHEPTVVLTSRASPKYPCCVDTTIIAHFTALLNAPQ